MDNANGDKNRITLRIELNIDPADLVINTNPGVYDDTTGIVIRHIPTTTVFTSTAAKGELESEIARLLLMVDMHVGKAELLQWRPVTVERA